MASRGGEPEPKPIKTSLIKSRILNVATPNNYVVNFTPPQAVKTFMEKRGFDPDLMREDIELRCVITTTPGTSFLTHSVSADYHGVVEEIPYRRAYENEIGMTFIVDNNYDTVAFFEAWVDYMSGVGPVKPRDAYKNNPYVNYRMNYYGGKNGYKCDKLFITKFERDNTGFEPIKESRDNKKLMTYTLINAYPKQINSMDLAYGPADEYLRLAVTFGYSRYVRERTVLKDQEE